MAPPNIVTGRTVNEAIRNRADDAPDGDHPQMPIAESLLQPGSSTHGIPSNTAIRPVR